MILGTPHTASAALDNFHHLWLYAALMAALSGLICTLLSPQKLAQAQSAPSQSAPSQSAAAQTEQAQTEPAQTEPVRPTPLYVHSTFEESA